MGDSIDASRVDQPTASEWACVEASEVYQLADPFRRHIEGLGRVGDADRLHLSIIPEPRDLGQQSLEYHKDCPQSVVRPAGLFPHGDPESLQDVNDAQPPREPPRPAILRSARTPSVRVWADGGACNHAIGWLETHGRDGSGWS